MSEPSRLYGIPITEWVLRTSAKMNTPRSSNERSTWALAWYETYQELGGRNKASGTKGCPRAAAYGLWFLGRLPHSSRPHLDWPVLHVTEELGRNAAYAVIAANLCRDEPARALKETWEAVRLEF